MFNAFAQSIKALRSNPARTVLTTLGIVIGIAAVIMVLSAGAGFRSLVDSALASWGTDTLFIETRVPPTTKNQAENSAMSADFSRAGSAVAITTFKQADLDSIKKLGNIAGVYGIVMGQAVVSYKNVVKNVMFHGAGAERFSIDKHALKSGRFFTKAEDTGASQVVILESHIAEDLFLQDDPLGKLIRVGNLNFQVIGVYDPQGSFGGGTGDDSLYMPLQTAQKKMLGINYITVAVSQLKNINEADATVEQIKQIMRRNHSIIDPLKDDFTVTTQAQAMDTFNTIFGGITILLIAIAAISLVVGGVGIMNIMYVIVTERTNEIGLKKALGATNGNILGEFFIEAVLVTVFGGVLGIILGTLLAFVVAKLAAAAGLEWTFTVPLYSVLIGVGVSGAIGMVFGVLPARSASNLDPVEALRAE